MGNDHKIFLKNIKFWKLKKLNPPMAFPSPSKLKAKVLKNGPQVLYSLDPIFSVLSLPPSQRLPGTP